MYDNGVCYDIILENTNETMRVDSKHDMESIGFDNTALLGAEEGNPLNKKDSGSPAVQLPPKSSGIEYYCHTLPR